MTEPFSKNFSGRELRCKCSSCNRKVPNQVKTHALMKLQKLREDLNRPIHLTSAYRCSKHPVEARKTRPGQHNAGVAFDISIANGAEGYEIMKWGFDNGASGVAVGSGFVHLDWRDSTPVVWKY